MSVFQVPMPIQPNQSTDVSLSLENNGPIQRMEPITNLQVRTAGPSLTLRGVPLDHEARGEQGPSLSL